MQFATEELLTKVPESYKPNLSKIKSYIKFSGRVPKGISQIPGYEDFKLTINNNQSNNEV